MRLRGSVGNAVLRYHRQVPAGATGVIALTQPVKLYSLPVATDLDRRHFDDAEANEFASHLFAETQL